MSGQMKIEPWKVEDDRVELAATLDLAGKSQRLWWRVPIAWRDALTTWADPFVIGLLFPAMQAGGEVEIVGPVSPSLLANLERFADVWRLWSPARYRPVRLWSRDEREPPTPDEPASFAMPFSAGVDSSFTAYRHARGLAGRNARCVGVGVTKFGFDIQGHQLNAQPMYDAVAAGAARMLASLGIPHVEISSNFRALGTLWAESHGTQLASGLALFGRRFGGALVPNSVPAHQLATIWGSHPLTDPMLSSDRFAILDDAPATPRWAKCAAIAAWPEAMADLRVCFGVAGSVGNCGRCEKCIRTALAFKIAGVAPPNGLPRDVPRRDFKAIRLRHEITLAFWRELAAGIEARGLMAETWAADVRGVLRRATRIAVAKAIKRPFAPLRGGVRQLFRGSNKSRKELAAERSAGSS